MQGESLDLVEVRTFIRAVWGEALALDPTNLNDSFLDSGGDSLAAMLCISRIRSRYEVEFLLEEFFTDDATIEKLSHAVYKTATLFSKSVSGLSQ